MLTWLRHALDGRKGWMHQAFRSFEGPVRVEVRTLGGPHLQALVIELHCADELLEKAVQQARGVLSRIRQGAATEQHLRRAASRSTRDRLRQRLDPRHRLASTWRERPKTPEAPSLSSWKNWLQSTLSDDDIAIVMVKPPRSEKSDED